MSSHDIRHMTSRHDFISIKFGIWLLYVAVSELERWLYFCFARYLGREIYSNYRRLGDLHHDVLYIMPSRMHSRVTLKLKVTSWSTWPLLSLVVFVLPRWFLLFRKNFRSGNYFQLSPFALPSRLTLKLNVTSWSTWHMSFLPVFVPPQWFFFVSWGFWVREFILTIATRVTLTYDLETQGHVMVYVTFVISGHLYVSYRNDFLFCQVFRSRNSFWLLPLAWPSRVTLKRKVPSWSTCFNNITKQKVTQTMTWPSVFKVKREDYAIDNS